MIILSGLLFTKPSYAIQDTQSIHVNLIKDYHIILAVIKFRKLVSIAHRYREKLVCRYQHHLVCFCDRLFCGTTNRVL